MNATEVTFSDFGEKFSFPSFLVKSGPKMAILVPPYVRSYLMSKISESVQWLLNAVEVKFSLFIVGGRPEALPKFSFYAIVTLKNKEGVPPRASSPGVKSTSMSNIIYYPEGEVGCSVKYKPLFQISIL